jgi:serine/threonine-protein kinase
MRRKSDGKIVMIDFGAVKQVSTQLNHSQGQSVGTIPIGTPGYMPSEQERGCPNFCSDIYAVGMVAIQALTGVAPHQLSTDPKTLEVIWKNDASVSPNLADVLDKMVRYDFKQRYQSATDALHALRKKVIPPPPEPNNWMWLVAVCLGIVASAVAALSFFHGPKPNPQTNPTTSPPKNFQW